jgi:hypothetical protein
MLLHTAKIILMNVKALTIPQCTFPLFNYYYRNINMQEYFLSLNIDTSADRIILHIYQPPSKMSALWARLTDSFCMIDRIS